MSCCSRAFLNLEGRKEGRKDMKQGRKKGRKEGRKEGRKDGEERGGGDINGTVYAIILATTPLPPYSPASIHHHPTNTTTTTIFTIVCHHLQRDIHYVSTGPYCFDYFFTGAFFFTCVIFLPKRQNPVRIWFYKICERVKMCIAVNYMTVKFLRSWI